MGHFGDWLSQTAGQGVTGAILGEWNDWRQRRQQKKLQEQQIEGNKEMIDYNMAKQLEMWEKTNYGAQKAQMIKAGLNPALMYGMSGGGGVTTGTPTGSVDGGQAPVGGGEMGMGIQMGLMQAQKELLESQAEKNRVEAAKTRGVDTTEAEARVKSLLQGVDNAKSQQILMKIETRLKEMEVIEQAATQSNRIDKIAYETEMALNELKMARNEAYISTATMADKVKIIQQTAIGSVIQNALARANVANVNQDTKLKGIQGQGIQEQMKLVQPQINKWVQEVAMGWKDLDLKDQKLELERFVEALKANFPTIGEAAGRLINDGLEEFFKAIKGERFREYEAPTKPKN